MIDFEQLLVRADDETLQHLVGPSAVKLLTLLDPALSRPSQLRRLVSGFRTPLEALRDPAVRRELLLLLPPDDAVELATRLRLDVDDPYSSLSALTLRKGSQREEVLLQFLDVPGDSHRDERETPPTQSKLDARYSLFTHQRTAVRDVRSRLIEPGGRVLLHMPTGAGKTRTAMHVVADVLRRREPALVTWLAYNEELCEQAAVEFENAWSFLGDRPLSVHRFWGNRDLDLDDVTDGLLVAGLGKLYAATRRSINFTGRIADRTMLAVFDEAHQATAETYQLVLKLIIEKSPDATLLGLSATPGRTWNDRTEDRELADFFHRHKVTLQIPGYDSPVDYLIDEGYLAEPDFIQLEHDPSGLSSQDLRDVREAFEIPESILRRLAQDEQRNLLIVTQVEQLLSRHDRILVFAATVEHSRLLATVLRARGHDATEVSAATTPEERERRIRRFRNADGAPSVLCNYGVLTAGFDAPRTSAVVIARPTKSLVLYSQMVGRGTRGRRAGGNDTAEIVTVVDTILPGFGDMAEAFRNWEDVWQ